jgi:hypothetical protein
MAIAIRTEKLLNTRLFEYLTRLYCWDDSICMEPSLWQSGLFQQKCSGVFAGRLGKQWGARTAYDSAVAEADGDHNVAIQQCLALTGEAQNSSKERADGGYDQAKTHANFTRLSKLAVTRRRPALRPAAGLPRVDRQRGFEASIVNPTIA